MSKLNLSIPHQLSQEEALSRIKNLLKNLKEEQAATVSNVREEWNDNGGSFAFSAMGFDLSGNIAVNPSTVDIDAEVPFAVSMFSGTIKNIITQKASELLA